MVILSVSIYVTAAGCGAAEAPFFFSLTVELTVPRQLPSSQVFRFLSTTSFIFLWLPFPSATPPEPVTELSGLRHRLRLQTLLPSFPQLFRGSHLDLGPQHH